ncbi:MAG: hypothetical protein A2X48_12985 [Lentisphaerae bacterium GWF2_49_21]|nr:MAG: hypothetical protein A2X48_12985 [Lentisphaerae bacterium GWF2_49_21]
MNTSFAKEILKLQSNRVRRNYRGGALLDMLETGTPGEDSFKPEDWIASTTLAINPGLPEISNEGLAEITSIDNKIILKKLFQEEGHFYLGEKHLQTLGPELGFLLKFLDSSMRLHVQAHPTANFAKKHFGSPYGKFEAYFIIGVRDDVQGYIRLGFQHPPTPEEWKRIVLEQDIEAMDKCFEKIPVKEGEVWIVPGGLPHALGEGLLVIEIMEPSDLVVRCEFEREGIIVPPPARFMKKDPDFALKIFNFTGLSPEKVREQFCLKPQILHSKEGFCEELLIGSKHTPCFEVKRIKVSKQYCRKKNRHVEIAVVTSGTGIIMHNDSSFVVNRGERFLFAAATEEITIIPDSGEEIEIVISSPNINK